MDVSTFLRSVHNSRNNPCSSSSPKSSGRYISFTLSTKIYSWLESMAVIHNYGSVHKSIRDLLCWACTGQEEDYEWLFLTPHFIPQNTNNLCSSSHLSSCSPEESTIAAKQACTYSRGRSNTILDARVSERLHEWISTVAKQYNLPRGASSVLEIVCRCAIELGAADDIFESNECGHDLPKSTIDLYHDLGLVRSYHADNNDTNITRQQGDEDEGNETEVDIKSSDELDDVHNDISVKNQMNNYSVSNTSLKSTPQQ